jgi:hypothetical protein
MGEGYTPDRVKNGVFQAMMDVELKNDGPGSLGSFLGRLVLISIVT